MLFFNSNRLAGPWVAANTRIALFHGKGPKATQLNAIAFCHRVYNFFKDSAHDFLNITLMKMWIFIQQFLNQFSTNHSIPLETVKVMSHPSPSDRLQENQPECEPIVLSISEKN